VPIDVALAHRILDPSVFQLIILPTEQCNFRCTYCYEDFAVNAMRREVVDGLLNLISARADGSCDLYLSWFGGEPLLAAGTVMEVTRHARDAFHKAGRKAHGHATTNGYRLGPEVFARLLLVGVRHYQITLDGPAALHDRRRVRRDGRGTFDVIWRNLLAIRRAADDRTVPHFKVSLRLHYDGASVDQLAELVDEVVTHFAGCDRFSVNLHELERLGGPNDAAIVTLTSRQSKRVDEYAERLRYAGLNTDVAAQVQGYICYAARANSLVVRADGRLAKCTVALADPRNDVGRLLPDGRIAVDRSRLDPWLRGISSGDVDVLACPLVGLPELAPPAVTLPLLASRRVS
jgi:uncharacterized protein